MNYLQLDKAKTAQTVEQLNILLADYHLYYQKLRNFHWNVLGQNFFDLHLKFEELYDDAKLKIDELAERILTLRHQPVSNYSQYLSMSNLQESSANLTDKQMVAALLHDHGLLLGQLKKVVDAAATADDEGTMDITGSYIRELEKTSWMLDAWCSK